MYTHKNPYVLNKVFSMHEKCSHCGQKYKIEPSFFFGAMYTSYGIGVALGVATFIIVKLFLGVALLPTFASIAVVLLLLYPVIARLGRNVWISFFIPYQGLPEVKNG
ncbi:DUF983 domain-containing protein [uncultured Croceitalea sp.]|uniref:DUF983 domain-containing protein n=1 Tax=uncultured Croceitalea sp. TaxID=1798908 RepID=UPI00330622F2